MALTLRRSVLAGLLPVALTVSACATAGAFQDVQMSTRVGRQEPVDSLAVIVKVDDMPGGLGEGFASGLQEALAEHGVNAQVRRYSELDLDGVSLRDVAAFHYAMGCHPTNVYRMNYTVMSVKMNCVLMDLRRGTRLMSADVLVRRSTFHFGETNAQDAQLGVREFVERMQIEGLVGGPGASPAAPGFAAPVYRTALTSAAPLVPVPPPPAPVAAPSDAPPPEVRSTYYAPPVPADDAGRVLGVKVLANGSVQEEREDGH